ncbi:MULTISPECIES: ABC transporter ATP-binding protein [unclassified Rhizobium]|uniref:ABC transporter ATP-binding protein n=1 Tax=unclassified Rhizobium TaxID=2613769 RepID=UPI0017828F2D|nr:MULTISPECIES: ABC transporter ATP-binding protein [unclassified Rhizobium]MBD8687643.1 ABC transporter ATP-binding protein [Rhizobium sp. CFBP 13644]MBD8692097.1 ABC transporter ATP-binding protein [Rhizobium sp. CFBP 13717]
MSSTEKITKKVSLAPVQTQAEVVISFKDVGKTFKAGAAEIQATRDINVDIREGEIVTIVGPSGCGKSTMLNLTAGLLAPTVGTVTYRNVPITDVNGRTGYMTQSDHLLPWRTVAGNISVPLEIRGMSKADRNARVEELAELVGLTQFLNSYPTQLSGGMRKRAALARLLAYDPETLLLDEPFAALDAQLRIKMQTELFQLSRRLKKTVLFVTHDIDEAVALGDRCLVFSGRPGTIVQNIEVQLPRERSILALRKDPTYQQLCSDLWDILAPSMNAAH